MLNLITKKDDIEMFKKKIDDLNAELDSKDNAFQIFLNDLHKELISTIAQHDIVNEQHEVIGEMLKKIMVEFNRVEDNTVASHNISEQVLKNGVSLISSSDQIVSVSQNSKEAVDAVEKIIDSIGAQSRTTSQNMNELSELSKQIENIVKVIGDISKQTNLLALNASIEASRAGEDGKGFAVVANEVRKLAESTKVSTENIANLTKSTQDQILKVEQDTHNSLLLAEEGMKTSAETSEQMNVLLQLITVVQGEMKKLLEDIDQQKSSSEEVLEHFRKTSVLFGEANDIINSHIDEADIVTKQLLKAVDLVKNFPAEN